MGLSRSTRIIILLVIDVVFFFVELISGYAVGSLALVADSFHMLNDVLSLVVALYAIKLSQNAATDQYSYGWHRAEILGALVNGVFLLALCCSIIMEALERVVSPNAISAPQVIILVGSLGLLSNLVGLLLFHEHSHGHGHSHSHSHTSSSASSITAEDQVRSPHEIERQPLLNGGGHGHSPARAKTSAAHRARSPSITSSLYVHPAQTRAQIVQVANEISHAAHSPSLQRRSRLSLDKDHISPPSHRSILVDLESGTTPDATHSPTGTIRPTEPRVPRAHAHSHSVTSTHSGHSHSPEASRAALAPIRVPSPAHSHDHEDEAPHGHGHSHGGAAHGSMNMRALVLHVIGDALGNVGVIATGLVILLAEGDWRLYFDPCISLVISVIIFSSAWPLVKSTSIILLQGVPSHVSLNDVRVAMLAVEGVRSIHELHVWQLSETKVIASVHVQIAHASDYMYIASEIRRVLHDHGVHSATIQPEVAEGDASANVACLVSCPPNDICDDTNVCCPNSIVVP